MVDSVPKEGSGRKLFYGLFIFPLIIVVGMAILLCTVVLLTREVETPESLITAIKTGSPSKRWQKAFELSNELNQGRGMIRESGVMKEIIHILNDRVEYDAKTRAYMAIALSRFQEPEVVPALEAALVGESSSDVQLHLIWALGAHADENSVKVILPFLKREEEALRKIAVYVLGSIGNEAVAKEITPLLKDSVRDVRWNAALSLARLNDGAGYSELMNMLDRNLLVSYGDMSEEKIEQVMINALKGIALLKNEAALAVLDDLAKQDKSLKVRQAAMDALELISQPVSV